MRRLERAVIGGAVIVLFVVAPTWALFETSKDLSDKARVSLVDAVKTAEQRIVPGTAVEVRMAKGGGRVLYKVEILDANKRPIPSTWMPRTARWSQ
jgi:hypothetical protein